MSFILALLSPLWGGLIYGVERKLKARMQSRVGPPILQPFYDMFKLMDKVTPILHPTHVLLALFYFVTLWVAVFMLFVGSNLLFVMFTHLLATIFYVLSGFSVRSIFSNLGANRKLLSLVAYEPVLILLAMLLFLVHGSFDTSKIAMHQHFSWSLLIALGALLFVAPAVLKSSPFDAPKAHQEIVGGVEVEFGGLFYEVLYVAKFLEMIYLYGLVFLVGGWVIMGLSFILLNLVDNATVRVRIDTLVTLIYKYAFSLMVVALLWRLYEI